MGRKAARMSGKHLHSRKLYRFWNVMMNRSCSTTFVVTPAERSTGQQHKCQGKRRKHLPTPSPDRGNFFLATTAYSEETVKAGWVLALPRLWSRHVLQAHCELQQLIWKRLLKSWSASLSKSSCHDKTSSGRGRHSLRLHSSVSHQKKRCIVVFACGTFVCMHARGSSTAMQAANAIERRKPYRSNKKLYPGVTREVHVGVPFKGAQACDAVSRVMCASLGKVKCIGDKIN